MIEFQKGEKEYLEEVAFAVADKWDELTSEPPALRAMFRSRFENHLCSLFQDNDHLSRDELLDIAGKLSPGGHHTGGLLIQIASQFFFLDETISAAAHYLNWHGGKVGFQFLPDPAQVDFEEYQDEAYELALRLEPIQRNPQRFLSDEDWEMYEALPQKFTVYRGCAGIDAETAGLGLCWTTSRTIANWFAHCSAELSNGCAPITVRGRVDKDDVLMTLAGEDEVVCQPRLIRELKTPKRKPPRPWSDP